MAQDDLDVKSATLKELQQALSEGKKLDLSEVVRRVHKELEEAVPAVLNTKAKVDASLDKIKARKSKSGKQGE